MNERTGGRGVFAAFFKGVTWALIPSLTPTPRTTREKERTSTEKEVSFKDNPNLFPPSLSFSLCFHPNKHSESVLTPSLSPHFFFIPTLHSVSEDCISCLTPTSALLTCSFLQYRHCTFYIKIPTCSLKNWVAYLDLFFFKSKRKQG